jgi:hypothetical protein
MQIYKTDFIGPLVLIAINKQSKKRPRKRLKKSNVTVQVCYHSDYTEIKKPYVSPDDMELINKTIKMYYEMAFNSHVMIGFGSDEEKIIVLIEQFRSKYGITDDELDFETSRKAFYRLRKRANAKENIKQIPVLCPFFSDMMDVTLSSK